MNYAQFKKEMVRRHNPIISKLSVVYNLTNAEVVSQSVLAEGKTFTCTIQATNGKYMPPVIEVSGTKSAYGFKYDYTTGVIYIPADEVIGDITITVVGNDYDWNVPAQLEVSKVTGVSTYDGTTSFADESFLKFDIYPCRGSTVNVSYGGITKTVTGDLTTDTYESSAKEVYFGTYLGAADETETPESGTLTIQGAYESYSIGSYKTQSTNSSGKTTTSSNKGCTITSITETGAIRLLRGEQKLNVDSGTVSFNRPIYNVYNQALFSTNGAQFNFNCEIMNADTVPFYTGSVFSSSSWGVSYMYETWGFAFEKMPTGFFGNGSMYPSVGVLGGKINVSIPEGCTKIKAGLLHGFPLMTTLHIPATVTEIEDGFTSFGSCTYTSASNYGGVAVPTITVDENNPNYYCEKNSVIERNTKHLVGGYQAYDKTLSSTAGNTELWAINVPNGTKTVAASAFYGVGDEFDIDYNTSYINFYGHTVENIGAYAFAKQRTCITYVILEDGTELDRRLPSSLKSIGDGAFYGDVYGTETYPDIVYIPESVESIGSQAFTCYNTSATYYTVYMLGTTPPTIKADSFEGTVTFIVPAGSLATYQAADVWSTLADKITEATA